jgi:SAM-dependent methyltransferase
MDLDKIYSNRFVEKDLPIKNKVWEILCRHFFSRFILKSNDVVDIGAGYCEFINNIECNKKIAVDLNQDTKKFAHPDVKVICSTSVDIKSVESSSVDIVFISNFLEHLLNKQEVFKTLQEAKRLLRSGGKILILQPNIRFLSKNYWDFFDHHTPLSDRSLIEVLELLDMKIIINYPKFLPYTTKSRFSKKLFFVKLYLYLPFVWKILGK